MACHPGVQEGGVGREENEREEGEKEGREEGEGGDIERARMKKKGQRQQEAGEACWQSCLQQAELELGCSNCPVRGQLTGVIIAVTRRAVQAVE